MGTQPTLPPVSPTALVRPASPWPASVLRLFSDCVPFPSPCFYVAPVSTHFLILCLWALPTPAGHAPTLSSQELPACLPLMVPAGSWP